MVESLLAMQRAGVRFSLSARGCLIVKTIGAMVSARILDATCDRVAGKPSRA